MSVESALIHVIMQSSKQLYSCSRVMECAPNKPTDLVLLANYENAASMCLAFSKFAEYLANYLASRGSAALCTHAVCQRHYSDLVRMGLRVLDTKTIIKEKTTELLKLVHSTAIALLKVAPTHCGLIEICSSTSVLPRILRLVAEQERQPESLGLLTLATLSSLKMPATHVHGGFISCVGC